MLFELFLTSEQPNVPVEKKSVIALPENVEQIKKTALVQMAFQLIENVPSITQVTFAPEKFEGTPKLDTLYIFQDTSATRKPWECDEYLLKIFKESKGYFGGVSQVEQLMGKIFLKSIPFQLSTFDLWFMIKRDQEKIEEIAFESLGMINQQTVKSWIEKRGFDPVGCAEMMIRCSDKKRVLGALKTFPLTYDCALEMFHQCCEILDQQSLVQIFILEQENIDKQSLFEAILSSSKIPSKKVFSSLTPNKQMLLEFFDHCCSKLASENCLETAVAKNEKINEIRLILEMMENMKTDENKFTECIEQVFKTIFWHLLKRVGQSNLSPEVQGCITLISEFAQKQTPPPPPLIETTTTTTICQNSEESSQEKSNMSKKSNYLRILQKAGFSKIPLRKQFSMADSLDDLKKEADRVSEEMGKIANNTSSLSEQLKEVFAKKFPNQHM